MPLFFHSDLASNLIRLPEEESRHAIKVLRMHAGDELTLTDGKGTRVRALVLNPNPKHCELEVKSRETIPNSRAYRLTLAVAPAKNAERNDWFIEKAVECGVDAIRFIETENSERSKINLERCERIAISAMKQSKQWWLPQISPVISFEKLLPEAAGHKLIACCDYEKRIPLEKVIAGPSRELTILIGPEGDFTPAEINKAVSHGFIPVSLGNTILRTETAALYACMAVKAIYATLADQAS